MREHMPGLDLLPDLLPRRATWQRSMSLGGQQSADWEDRESKKSVAL